MSAFPKFLVGLIALAVLGFLGFYAGIIPNETSEELETRLQRFADEKAKTNEFSWAQVEMDGQKAIITGTAPSAEARDKLRRIVLSAEWAGGVVSGGVTKVDLANVKVAKAAPDVQTANPYTWNAIYGTKDGPVTLTGYVPSEEIRAEILAEAKALFPGGVVDELQIANGAPSDTWNLAVKQNLKALSLLDRGGITAVNTKFSLYGEVDDVARRDNVLAGLSSFVPNYTSDADISAPEPVIIAEPAPVVEEPPAPEPQLAIDTCQADFNEILKDKINFASSRAVINSSSYPVLDKLAALSKKCTGYNVEIQGHTDSSGPAEMNMKLSQMRANAVLAYLTSKGVDVTHFTAKGYGEDKWIGDNRTAAGRAANRRIEFKVTAN